MAPKRVLRKSRMDLLLENMEAAEKNVMSAADFLAQDDSSSSTFHRGEEEDDSLSSSDDDNLSLAQVTSPNTQSVPQRSAMQTVPRQQHEQLHPTSSLFGAHSAKRSPTGQNAAKSNPKAQNRSAPFSPLSPNTKSASDRDFGGVASPLFLSELALRQRKKDMAVERILLEAEAAGVSSHGQPLCSLVNALCGNADGDTAPKSKTNGHSDICDDTDQDLFELDAFIGSGANVVSNKTPLPNSEEEKFNVGCQGGIGRYADKAIKSLSMLRTMGISMPSFIASLTQTPLYRRDDGHNQCEQKRGAGGGEEKRPPSPSRLVAKAYLAFLRFVFLQCATETIVKPDIFKFLIDILRYHHFRADVGNGLGLGCGGMAAGHGESNKLGGHNDTDDTTDDEETIACLASPKCISSAERGLSLKTHGKQQKPPARGTGSHWAVLLASAASPTTASVDEASKPLIAEGSDTKEEEHAAENEAKRVRRAMSTILTPAELEKVTSDGVSVTELVCDLLTYLLVSSNRQSLFSGGLIAGGGVGGSSGALESQHSDLSDLFMTSSQAGSSQFELEGFDAEEGLTFGSDQNPSKITRGMKRQRSSPTFAETDGTEPLARKRTSPRLENCSASIVFHYLGGFTACLCAIASFVEQFKRTGEGAEKDDHAEKKKDILALEGEENSSTNKIVSMREINKVLSLVEVATCSDALKNKAAAEQVKDVLNRILVMIFELWEIIGEGATTANSNNKNNTENNCSTPAQQKDGLGDSSQRVLLRNMLLRVATNITGVCHDAIPADHEGSRLCAERIVLSLTHYSAPVDLTAAMAVKALSTDYFNYETIRPHVDEVCELVCLAINFCRRGANNEFRWALLNAEGIRQTVGMSNSTDSSSGNFAEWCVGWLCTLYHVEDSSANILAGYLALLLAMLSLGDEEARIRVVTALSTNAKEDIRTVASKPLTWVVAVLQEFVLFQSTAQILTKDMVVAMHSVIDRVISENGISVSTA